MSLQFIANKFHSFSPAPMNRRTPCARLLRWLLAATAWSLLVQQCAASIGDRLPDFRECVTVRVFTFL
jgi:hypothetical protein